MEIVDNQQQQMTDTASPGFMPMMELNQYTDDKIIVYQCIHIAEQWRTFRAWFDENRAWLIELKKRMGARQGVEGKKMDFNGVMLTWSEFVERHMKVTARWMRELLGEKPEPKDNSTGQDEKPNKKKYTEDDVAAAREEGYEEGYATAAQEYEGNEGEAEDESEPQTSDDVELDAAHQRIAELEAEIEKLNAAPDAMQLMSEKEKVLAYAKRISGGHAEMLKLVFDEIAESLGLSDRITVTVE
jgi:hypothetical protein